MQSVPCREQQTSPGGQLQGEEDDGDTGANYDTAGTLVLLQSPDASKNLWGLNAIIDVMETDPGQVYALLASQMQKYVVALLAPVVTGKEEQDAKANIRHANIRHAHGSTHTDPVALAKARRILGRVTVALRAAEALDKMLETHAQEFTSPALRPVLFETDAKALLIEMMREGMGMERGDVATKTFTHLIDPHVDGSLEKVAEGDTLPLLMTMLQRSRADGKEDGEMAARAIELLDDMVTASSTSPVREWLSTHPLSIELLVPWAKHVPGQEDMLTHLVSMLARIVTYETTQRMLGAGLIPALLDVLLVYGPDNHENESEYDYDTNGYILEDIGTIFLNMAEADIVSTTTISLLSTPQVAERIVRTLEYYTTNSMTEMIDVIVCRSQPVRTHLMANAQKFLNVMSHALYVDNEAESRNAANAVAQIAARNIHHGKVINQHNEFMNSLITLLHNRAANTTSDLVAYAWAARALICIGHAEAEAFFRLRAPHQMGLMLNTYLHTSQPASARVVMADIVRLLCEASECATQEFTNQRTAVELVKLLRDIQDTEDEDAFPEEGMNQVSMALAELAELNPENERMINQCGVEAPYDTYDPSKDNFLVDRGSGYDSSSGT